MFQIRPERPGQGRRCPHSRLLSASLTLTETQCRRDLDLPMTTSTLQPIIHCCLLCGAEAGSHVTNNSEKDELVPQFVTVEGRYSPVRSGPLMKVFQRRDIIIVVPSPSAASPSDEFVRSTRDEDSAEAGDARI
ncbi:hypothetical protein JOB18_007621 [Solea senegalensis]|uniref:Uncharacterized protein n=1 Tax=Solea senegalensis TaxID=28829 RepID=A0AAV6SL07_SOLSE|nr:hypothetical protein JOB18_007621 [Solea senegalensis]